MDVERLFRSSWHYKGVHNLPPSRGTIKTARFEKPKLQFYKGAIATDEGPLPVEASMKHSDRDDMIHCGLATNLYFRLMQNMLKGELPDSKDLRSYRFKIMIEKECIIGLASAFETFIKGIIIDVRGFKHVPHNFKQIEKSLRKKDIKIRKLGDLDKREHFDRMKEIVNFLFLVRNLMVHNGGIVDKPFQKYYGGSLKKNMIGQLIRIEYTDVSTIRSWTSYLVQEICKKVPDHHKVWLDYVESVGIVYMSDVTATPVLRDGSEGPSFGLEEGE
jgi:hypothetical protein